MADALNLEQPVLSAPQILSAAPLVAKELPPSFEAAAELNAPAVAVPAPAVPLAAPLPEAAAVHTDVAAGEASVHRESVSQDSLLNAVNAANIGGTVGTAADVQNSQGILSSSLLKTNAPLRLPPELTAGNQVPANPMVGETVTKTFQALPAEAASDLAKQNRYPTFDAVEYSTRLKGAVGALGLHTFAVSSITMQNNGEGLPSTYKVSLTWNKPGGEVTNTRVSDALNIVLHGTTTHVPEWTTEYTNSLGQKLASEPSNPQSQPGGYAQHPAAVRSGVPLNVTPQGPWTEQIVKKQEAEIQNAVPTGAALG